MAVKDEKMADAEAEQDKRKKQKLKKKGAKGEEDKEADLSEEDLELKKNLELMLERTKDSDAGVQRTALEGIAKEIRSAAHSKSATLDVVPHCLYSGRSPGQGLSNAHAFMKLLVLAWYTASRYRRESTTSMTSVPKPLKFLRSHYKELKDVYDTIPAQNRNKAALADIISVMAVTSGAEGARESLAFRYVVTVRT